MLSEIEIYMIGAMLCGIVLICIGLTFLGRVPTSTRKRIDAFGGIGIIGLGAVFIALSAMAII